MVMGKKKVERGIGLMRGVMSFSSLKFACKLHVAKFVYEL